MTIRLLLLLFVAMPAGAFDPNEQRMIEWIDAHSEEAIALLEETVNISSGTMNHDGVRAVGRVMQRELDELGLETQWIDLPPEVNRAGHLFGRKLDGSAPRFLLIGHLDTVFEADDPFQAFAREGDRATGPGVDDMKSGNVIMVYALRALRDGAFYVSVTRINRLGRRRVVCSCRTHHWYSVQNPTCDRSGAALAQCALGLRSGEALH